MRRSAERRGDESMPQLSAAELQAATDTVTKIAEVCRKLRSATSAMEKLVRLAAGSGDLTLAHWLVLAHLSRNPTCRQVDLKSHTGIAPAYLTKLVDELTERGLVRRHRYPWDRRQILLALTMTGRESALRWLAASSELTNEKQLRAVEHLDASLDQFVAGIKHSAEPDGKSDAAAGER